MTSSEETPPPLKIILESKSDPYPKSTHWNESERRLWTVLMFAITSMLYAARTIVPLAAVNMSEEFGWDKTDAGLVLGSFFWGYPIAQIAGGVISDRIGGDYVILRAAMIWGVVTLITPLVPYFFTSKSGTIMSLAFLRFLMGLIQGLHYPSLTSLLSDKVSADMKAYVMSCVLASSYLGTLITGAVGSIIMEHSNWHYVFYFIGSLTLLIAYIVSLFSKKQRRRTFFSFQNGRAGTRKDDEERKPLPLMNIITKRPFWGLLVAHNLSSFTGWLLISWLPTYFKDVFPEAKGWVHNVLPWLIAVPVSVAGGCLCDTLIANKVPVGTSRKIIHTLSMVGVAVCLFGVAHTDSYTLSLLLIVTACSANSLCHSSLSPNPQDIAPKYAGGVFGIIHTSVAIQGFISTYAAGHILHATESWTTVFNLCSVMCLLSWLVFTCFASGMPVI